MDEQNKLMWWERFCDGLEEAVSECPPQKNEAVRGEEGWKKNEMDQLSDLWSRVLSKMSEDSEEVYRMKKMGQRAIEEEGLDKSDYCVQKAIHFREFWNSQWRGPHGSFEDVTLIHAMRYTYDHAPPLARPCDAVQIFSARLVGLQCPLNVFGMVAVRDVVDRNRNLLFFRTRDNCQTLTETDPYLVLTGPTRTVVATKNDTLMVEVYLKVKGNTENEDNYLIYYADHVPLLSGSYLSGSSVDNLSPFQCYCYSKHGMLEIRLGEIRSAVEATIFVRVIDGSWPDGFHGQFAARTSSQRQNFVLHDFGADEVRVDGDGYMNLSRHVVSVELEGSLKVSFMAWRDDKSFKACQDDKEIVNGEVRLKPQKAGRSYASFSFGSCVMEVLVAWSLVLPDPQPDVPDSFDGYPYLD